jgi:hypothetical protein
MLTSSMAWVCKVSTKTPASEIARVARADVARHGVVVLAGGRSEARQLRRVRGELRASGYQAWDLADDAGRVHRLIVMAPGQEMPRVLGWWGG